MPRLIRRLVRPPLVAIVVVVVGWWALSLGQPRYYLPGPDVVAARFWDLTFVSRHLWGALSLSMAALALGGGLAFIVGVPLGIIMGSNRRVERIAGPRVNAFYVSPVSALTFLFVYAFGIGLEPRIATVFVFCVPVIIRTCHRGARETSRTFIEVARVFGASGSQVFWKTIVPHAIP